MYTFNSISVTLTLFGAILIVGLISGEVSKKTIILPTISGYILTGLLLGPSGFGVISNALLNTANVFVDICFGLILFELGKNVNLRLMRNDPWLLVGSVTASLLAFVSVYIVLILFGYNPINSLLVAAIAITSSPAIVFMVAKELNSDSTVVRRTKNSVAINNVVGLLIFATILPYIHHKFRTNDISIWIQPAYFFFGSIAVSVATYICAQILSLMLGKNESKQFIMTTALILLNVGICYAYNLSALISLLFYGILIKNMNFKYSVMNTEFGNLEDLFFLLLFVITGANLSWKTLDTYLIPSALILIARFIGLSIPVYYSSLKSGCSKKQGLLVSTALAPIAATALGITNTTTKMYPEFSNSQSLQVILCSLLIMQLLGPIITRWAFKSADSLSNKKQ